ncbi:cytochrome c oxidase copper chaperone SenC [Biformimicrobium ophioploci]|uniref:Cytochrome c oxidase copper chaperone SenC n=1 Tax=Biformimicrobium ophioploci TaxID=3036711 RepID=A0ABQ6LY17_9GAMM|nr:cytochrome c oxidase copper chaperone SenC [Microbulbifer sp. NKW57]
MLSLCSAFLLSGLLALLLLPSGKEAPPRIQGVLIQNPLPLQPFTLESHTGDLFSNEQLRGTWHLIAYGYTHCPDICPATLATLTETMRALQQADARDTRVLFYSVDPQRDTRAKLALYVPYFDPGFIGLRMSGDGRHLGFERSLGIVAMLTPTESTPNPSDPTTPSPAAGIPYRVSHGVHIFLTNPDGALQAVFKPGTDTPGIQSFSAEQIARDYTAIRRHLR